MKLDNLEGHEHNLMFFGNTKNFKFSKKKKNLKRLGLCTKETEIVSHWIFFF